LQRFCAAQPKVGIALPGAFFSEGCDPTEKNAKYASFLLFFVLKPTNTCLKQVCFIDLAAFG